MATTTTKSLIPANLTTLYEQLKAQLLGDVQTVDYSPKSTSELMARLKESLTPTLEASIASRQASTRKNNAAIDADAAARGIGSSTWGTDVKNRNASTEAQDIAGMRGTYNSTLASNLTSQLSDQESKRLAVEQANASSRANAVSNALTLAAANYKKWAPSSSSGGSSGHGRYGGSSGGGSGSSSRDPYNYTRSYDTGARSSQKAKSNAIIAAYRAKNPKPKTLGR